MRLAFAPYTLRFKEPGGTSRGVLHEKLTVFLKIWDESDPSRYGIGEAAVFEGLSPEADANYPLKLVELLANIAIGKPTDLSHHSSIQFGLEQAILDFSNGCRGIYSPSSFTEGERSVEINGLVWMGSYDEMVRRAEEKLKAGFRCLKFKIGAIDRDCEFAMIREVRKRFDKDTLEIRVDANGAFKPDEALGILEELATLHIHSIEQPIAAGQHEAMAELCRKSPVPIALDEELIGISGDSNKRALLREIRPQYIILKPALCGGFSGASEWMSLAEEYGIGHWITSALESNVGLSALAQWTAARNPSMPQGLGTGNVFVNNFPSPLRLEGDRLRFDNTFILDRSLFDNLDWRE